MAAINLHNSSVLTSFYPISFLLGYFCLQEIHFNVYQEINYYYLVQTAVLVLHNHRNRSVQKVSNFA